MAESHDLDETIFGQPPAPFDHVIEHHRDLRNRTADVDEAEEEKIKKHFAPRRHLMICVGIGLLVCRRHVLFIAAAKTRRARRSIQSRVAKSLGQTNLAWPSL